MMKFFKNLLNLVFTTITFCAFFSCSKDEKVTLALITTDSLRAVGSTSLQVEANVSSDGNASVIRGICWSSNHVPTVNDDTTVDGRGKGSFISYIENLNSNTTYYFRAYATNSAVTNYGDIIKVTTTQTVTDSEGNVYNTVLIGNQLWMAENLKTTHYNNGDPITPFSMGDDVINVKEGLFTTPKNLGMGWDIFGAYYNWYAIKDKRSICPKGWHIPSDAEWTTLLNTIGEENFQKKILQHNYEYLSTLNGATNASGFSAVPAGDCMNITVGEKTSTAVAFTIVSFWSSTEVDEKGSCLYFDTVYPGLTANLIQTSKSISRPVRCIKD